MQKDLTNLDITELWKLRKAGELLKINARQNAILDLWEAWLGESEGDYETDCITVPNMLNELWELSSKTNPV